MKLLKIKEAAEQMRVSMGTVYLLCHKKKLPHLRFGRSIRIPDDELARYLEQCQVRQLSHAEVFGQR